MSDAPQPPPGEQPGPPPGWGTPPPAPPPGEQAGPPPGWGAPPPAPPGWGAPPAGGPPPGWGAPPPQQQWGPGYAPAAAPRTPSALASASPRVLVALGLVLAGASVLLAVLLTIVTIDADDYSFVDFGFLDRLQLGTGLVNLPLLLLLPLALLLTHPDGDRDGDPSPLRRLVVLGATVLGAAFTVFALLRLIADLGGEEAFVTSATKPGAFFYDLATILVAAASTYWAFRLLQAATARSAGAAPQPQPAPDGGWGPPPAGSQQPPPPPPTGWAPPAPPQTP